MYVIITDNYRFISIYCSDKFIYTNPPTVTGIMGPSVSAAMHFTSFTAYIPLHFVQVPMSLVLLCKRGINRALI